MKHKLNLTAAVIVALAIAGCNPLGKMLNRAGEVKYQVSPDPLELHGDSVEVNLSGSFPANFFHKQAKLNVKPMIVDQDGNLIKELKSLAFIGQDADGDGQKIDFVKGGSFSMSEKLPYTKKLQNVKVRFKASVQFKGTTKEFPAVDLGEGTVTLPHLLRGDERSVVAKGKYSSTVNHSKDAKIHYLVNSSAVRGSELKDQDVKDLADFIKSSAENGHSFESASIEAYASPDGEINMNENLANDRAKSATKYLRSSLKKAGIKSDDNFYAQKGKGEDWEGFKALMERSSIKDKDLVLRVLSMYKDPIEREKQIKNLANTYLEIRDDILPHLRKATVVLNTAEKAKTKEELVKLVDTAPETLTKNELLYSASLFSDIDQQLKVYQTYAKLHTDDWKGPNNVGYVYMLKNKLNGAQVEFEKAQKIDPKNAMVINNLGVLEKWRGDMDNAKEMFQSATSAGGDVYYNLANIAVKEGNYSAAVSNYSDNKTFNVALAHVLNGNPQQALSIIDQSDDKETAMGYYLKAIAGVKLKKKEIVINNLKSAFAKDETLKGTVRKNVLFNKYKEDADYQSLF